MHESEWLHLAKRLAVGQTKRFYHAAESRPNMVIRNLDDRYTCYCHACGKGAVKRKEHVKLTSTPKQPVVPTWDTSLLPRLDSTLGSSIPYAAVLSFLQSKDMSLQYLQALNPKWDPTGKRIVLHSCDQVIGRDITGLSKSKWLKYSGGYFARVGVVLNPHTYVLTEDLFSAAKGQYFASPGVQYVALTGTRLDDSLLKLLVGKKVYLMLDGDAAGAAGRHKLIQSLELFNIPYGVIKLAPGKDPKNLTPEQLSDLNKQIGG